MEAAIISESKYQITNKVAIVTGAGRGMGKATADLLAKHGATVIIADINGNEAEDVAKNIQENGGTAQAMVVDVADYDQVEQLVSTIYEKYGRIDILVNNAGIVRQRSSIEEISSEEWDRVLAVNLKGAFNCAKQVTPIMKKQRSGKIINISSSSGGRSVSVSGGAHYTASKAAILGLSRHLAKELAPFDINVNAICPGMIDTPMIRELMSSQEFNSVQRSLPMGRCGTPKEEAEVVLFLVSEAASYINGATIAVDGASLLI